MCKQERCHLRVLRDSIICNKTAFSQLHSLCYSEACLRVWLFFLRYSYRQDLFSSVVPRAVPTEINTWFEGTAAAWEGVHARTCVCVHAAIWVWVWGRQGGGGGRKWKEAGKMKRETTFHSILEVSFPTRCTSSLLARLQRVTCTNTMRVE